MAFVCENNNHFEKIVSYLHKRDIIMLESTSIGFLRKCYLLLKLYRIEEETFF